MFASQDDVALGARITVTSDDRIVKSKTLEFKTWSDALLQLLAAVEDASGALASAT